MDAVFYWTGAALWYSTAVLIVGFFAIGLILGVANSISLQVWTYKHAKKHGLPLKWSKLPLAFLVDALELFWYINRDNLTVYKNDTGAEWHGIGKWWI